MKNNKNKKKKIYKNKTRNKELKLVELFARSIADDEKAKRCFKILHICFSGISAFTELNHNKIVYELYFNKKYNVFDTKIVKMLELVSMSESTLKRYRDKYCLVAELVLALIEESQL